MQRNTTASSMQRQTQCRSDRPRPPQNPGPRPSRPPASPSASVCGLPFPRCPLQRLQVSKTCPWLGTEDVGSSCQLSVHVPPAVTCMAPQFFKLAQPVTALRLPTPAFTSPRHELDASHRVQRARDKGARLSLECIGWLPDRHTSSHLTAVNLQLPTPKFRFPFTAKRPRTQFGLSEPIRKYYTK